ATAVLVCEPRPRQQRAELQVSGARRAEKERAEGLVAIGPVLDPAVGTDDRLYASAASGAVELDHAEEVRGIGQRKGWHVVGGGAPDRIVDPDYAVAHRVLAMHPQVNETRPCHVKKFYRKGRRETPVRLFIAQLRNRRRGAESQRRA